MSTKIYNGLRLRNCTLEQALAKLRSIRPACVEAGAKAIASGIATRMAFAADLAENYCPLKPASGSSPYMRAQTDFFAAKAEVLGKSIRSVDWDRTLSITLIPHQGDLLALYFIERDCGYIDSLLDLGFERYGYQNSTDRPAEVSQEEWDARECDWEAALGRCAPCEVGFTYDVVTWHDLGAGFYCIDRIKQALPSAKARALAVAVELSELELDYSTQAKAMRLSALVRHVDAEAAKRADGIRLAEGVCEVRDC